jgi:hypothetical protein
VATKKVFDSVMLFNKINNTDKYAEFILVSNRNFTSFNMAMLVPYSIDDLKDVKSKIQRKLDGKLEENFLSKVKFMRGPEPESIHSIIRDELSCLSNPKSLSKDIISFVDSIWIGLKDITQFTIQDIEQRKKEDLAFKTITPERITNQILNIKDNNVIQFPDIDSESLPISGSSISEKINGVDEEQMKYLIKKYNRDSDFQDNILRKFDNLSRNTKLYQNIAFMKFLKTLSKNEDKHKLLYFFYIIHNLILLSKKHDEETFAKISSDYKRLLNDAFTNWNERYRYSYGKIKNILETLDLSIEEWCILHWERIKNAIIAGITKQEIDKIDDNISFLRNKTCKSIDKCRKYLSKVDNHIEVKKIIESSLIGG